MTLFADGQPSASAISLPGLRYCHMPCGTEIDSISVSKRRGARVVGGVAHRPHHQLVGLRALGGIVVALLMEADADDDRRVRASRVVMRSIRVTRPV